MAELGEAETENPHSELQCLDITYKRGYKYFIGQQNLSRENINKCFIWNEWLI